VTSLDIEIDKLTPCLEQTNTGNIVDTSFSPVTEQDLKTIKKWAFKWSFKNLPDYEIYKLTAANDDRIQGLVAIKDVPDDSAVYVQIAESAPHNRGKNKEYAGVGGHLFAIAVLRSYELGYDGFVFMDAKNLRLVSHYANTLGAFLIGTPHPYRMAIDEIAAKKLIKLYTLRRDSNE